jgi:hypothetical protein
MAIGAIAFSTVASAQSSKVSQAENLLILRKVDDAKVAIDAAMEHKKSSLEPATFVTAAKVYAGLSAKDGAAVEKVREYLEKAYELDASGKKPGKHLKKIQKALPEIALSLEQAGGELWNAKQYSESSKAFGNILWINSKIEGHNVVEDTSFMTNTGLAAMQAQEWARGAEYFKLAGQYSNDPMNFLRANYCYEQLKDSANIEASLKAGFEKFPSSSDMVNSLINYYLKSGKNQEALGYLNGAIKKTPDNAQYYFARGCLMEKIDINAAIADYEKASTLDTKYYNALYNLGVAYYNEAQKYKMEAGNAWKDKEKAAQLEAKSTEMLKKSTAPMEKAAKVGEDNKKKYDAYDVLKRVYYTLQDWDNNKRVTEEMKNLQ